jgi:uncharacterized protein (DUF1501 family)
MSHQFPLTRRHLLKLGTGALGLSLADVLALRHQARASAATPGHGRARSCIVLFCWGGVSHLDTWDPKPDASAEVRGEFRPIRTRVPGIVLGEHMPLLAQHTDKLAIIRSIHHRSTAHGKGMYWNVTGHPAPSAEVAENLPPSRQDWPSLGALIARFRRAPAGLPANVQLPYPMVDNSTLQAGENAGWLGRTYDPVIFRPDRGRPYGGVSRDLGTPVLCRDVDLQAPRLRVREELTRVVDRHFAAAGPASYLHYQQMAWDMLRRPEVQTAFDLDREPAALRDRYGEHLCGQSVLLARRLTEAGVPVVTVICAAGDLNNSVGDHWDTHSDNFNRLQRDLLPPLDRAASALLQDLADRGRLDETLVVFLTEFGRTPRIRNSGRDHYPFCYSVALAGGGIAGGQVYGSSDRIGALPREQPCGPHDLHATIFQALGIPLDAHLADFAGRSFPITEGRPLPLFGAASGL